MEALSGYPTTPGRAPVLILIVKYLQESPSPIGAWDGAKRDDAYTERVSYNYLGVLSLFPTKKEKPTSCETKAAAICRTNFRHQMMQIQ